MSRSDKMYCTHTCIYTTYISIYICTICQYIDVSKASWDVVLANLIPTYVSIYIRSIHPPKVRGIDSR
ncbi:hypothetical protein F4775DRAFT_560620 [Biscogniauxia sp. FL1348]|nr:hypothetical protein F4775DRAFT_560620 [Biscogniauxia sp. FL1348]